MGCLNGVKRMWGQEGDKKVGALVQGQSVVMQEPGFTTCAVERRNH